LYAVDYDEVSPLFERLLELEDPEAQVAGWAASGIARAASLLTRTYTLIATNPPFVSRGRQAPSLREYCRRHHFSARSDLAVTFMDRARNMVQVGGTYAFVSPEAWRTLTTYETFRTALLNEDSWNILAQLGPGAFEAISGEIVAILLTVITRRRPTPLSAFAALDASTEKTVKAKSSFLNDGTYVQLLQSEVLANPDSRVILRPIQRGPLLQMVAQAFQGLATGEQVRFTRCFWELPRIEQGWVGFQGTVQKTVEYGGREAIILWEDGHGKLNRFHEENRERLGGAPRRGIEAWGKHGVAVSQMSSLPCTLYTGEIFDNSTAVLIPMNQQDLPGVWAFCNSSEFAETVRLIDSTIKVTNSTLAKVPFDAERWREVAKEAYPVDLPKPYSKDPTQWLFKGLPAESTNPLHVAAGRLLGYRWPGQEPDLLDVLADEDGAVPIPAVAGERPAAERIRAILERAYGDRWSPGLLLSLLDEADASGKDLETWLRDFFFASHAKLFQNRPFIWHIWDGRKDGFAALVNYHRLDGKLLSRVTHTLLGSWIELQRDQIRTKTPGGEGRLAAAEDLQRKLMLIAEGEPPYDIYVRWKPLANQPIGWEPDLDDGVRLNIRPFVQAGVLRSKFTINWKKDRGTDSDGSERINDYHFSRAQKLVAREKASTA
jgi:hypothetical protein